MVQEKYTEITDAMRAIQSDKNKKKYNSDIIIHTY